MDAKQEIVALMRMADGDSGAALVRLAELFDEHVREPTPPEEAAAAMIDPTGSAAAEAVYKAAIEAAHEAYHEACDAADEAHDNACAAALEMWSLERALSVTSVQITEALASAGLDRGECQTLSVEVRGAD